MKTEDCITRQANITVSWPVLFGVVLFIMCLVSGSVGATAYIMSHTSDIKECISEDYSRETTFEDFVERNKEIMKNILVVKKVLRRVETRLSSIEEKLLHEDFIKK